jgi:hypothetical protein
LIFPFGKFLALPCASLYTDTPTLSSSPLPTSTTPMLARLVLSMLPHPLSCWGMTQDSPHLSSPQTRPMPLLPPLSVVCYSADGHQWTEWEGDRCVLSDGPPVSILPAHALSQDAAWTRHNVTAPHPSFAPFTWHTFSALASPWCRGHDMMPPYPCTLSWDATQCRLPQHYYPD